MPATLQEALRDLSADAAARGRFATDPAEYLRQRAHDLPDPLIAEAITALAPALPLEVAEHLSPYIVANSAVPSTSPEMGGLSGLELLASAPDVIGPPLTDISGVSDVGSPTHVGLMASKKVWLVIAVLIGAILGTIFVVSRDGDSCTVDCDPPVATQPTPTAAASNVPTTDPVVSTSATVPATSSAPPTTNRPSTRR